MLVLNQKVSCDDEKLRVNFIQLATNLAQLLHSLGLKTQAGLKDFPYFSALNSFEKATAVERLQFYYNLCMEQQIEGQSLRDSKKFTWRALVKLGLIPESDFLDRLENDDIIEIYNQDHVQLFRNLEFFDICSYSIEELYCIQWWKLFRREPAISETILNMCTDLYLKKYPSGLVNPLPIHWVEECLSRSRYCMDLQLKFLGPLLTNKKVSALICIERATLRTAHS